MIPPPTTASIPAPLVANSLIFLMVAISVSLREVLDHIDIIGWAVLAVPIARAHGVLAHPDRGPIAQRRPIHGRMRTVMFRGRTPWRDVDAICKIFPAIKQALVSAFESRSAGTVMGRRRSSRHYEV